MTTDVTDETLYDLTATQRRVVRLMAQGGWATGSPGTTAVEATVEDLGMHGKWQAEQVRGEPRAFYPEGRGGEREWKALAERLDALPRRPRRKAHIRRLPRLPEVDVENDVTLTRVETKTILTLQHLAARWPQSLRLVSMDGSLYVVRTNDERFHSDDGVVRNESVIVSISGIPNEGGGW